MIFGWLVLLLGLASASPPAYFSWIMGNSADVTTTTKGVTMCQGGGQDVDEAVAWMLKASGGGDVVVIRDGKNSVSPSPTADAYNEYFYKNLTYLGVSVDSVETIWLNSRAVANNAQVVATVRAAECLFFTGGEQNNYFNYISGSLMADAIKYLQTVKKVPVGGTSAGCAIQGQYMYSALLDKSPYSFTFNRSFYHTPYLYNVTTDTHFSQRNRQGRLVAFLARMSSDFSVALPAGIGLDEQTAIAIDERTSTGRARFDLVSWRPGKDYRECYWYIDNGYAHCDC